MSEWKYPWQERESSRKKELKNISTRSRKLETEERIHSVLKKDYLKDHPFCQCLRPGCTRKSTDVHHKKGRGVWLNVVEFFLSVCRNCHDWIEANPKEAKKLGYSLNRIEKSTKKIGWEEKK